MLYYILLLLKNLFIVKIKDKHNILNNISDK